MPPVEAPPVVKQLKSGWLFVAMAMLILAVVAVSIFYYSTVGQKLVNNLSPTPARTLELYQKLHDQTDSFRVEFTGSQKDILRDGFYTADSASSLTVSFEVFQSAPSSTFAGDRINRTVIFKDGEVYISDIFLAEVFTPLDDTYINEAITATLQNIAEIFAIDVQNFMYEVNDEYTIESDVNHFFIKTPSPHDAYISIDKNTYELKGISLGDTKTPITLVPSVDSQIVPQLTISEFGDLLARESVALRTERIGAFDYLWERWEQTFFDCYRCVYRLGDEDGDGIRNLSEFVLGTDPFVADRNQADTNVPDYAPFFTDTLYMGTTTGARSGYLVWKVAVPVTAMALTFSYSLPLETGNNSYFGVYLDGDLQALLPPTETATSVQAAVIVPPSIVGESVELAFVLNSVGAAGDSMQVKDISFLTHEKEVPIVKSLRQSGYKLFVHPKAALEIVPLRLSDTQWQPSAFAGEVKTEPQSTTNYYEGRLVPGITLTAPDQNSVGAIKLDIDNSDPILPTICVGVPEGKQFGHLEFQFLPKDGNQYELVTAYSLDTIYKSTRTGRREDFMEASVLLNNRGPGTLVIALLNDGNGEAAATFAHFSYYTEEIYLGSVESLCNQLRFEE